MADIVRHYDLGVVSDNFNAVALSEKLNQLTRVQIESFKKNATRAAKELNAEANAIKINKLVSDVLNNA